MPPVSHVKLIRLAELMGYPTMQALFEAYLSEAVVPGICMNDGCDYVAQVDRDEREGYCPQQGTTTVQSCLVIAGLI
jgi:hypothetical protein